MKLAVVFPGQGSQRVGMGNDWLGHAAARRVYEAADAALDFKLSEICFEGPAEELTLTAITQPAILTTSFAIYQAIRDELPDVACLAGHSLGEYTALVAAKAITLEEAVVIVHKRGKLMQEAVPPGAGAMAAVVGLEKEKVDVAIKESGEESLSNLFPGEVDFAIKALEVLEDAEDAPPEGEPTNIVNALISGVPAAQVAEIVDKIKELAGETIDIANYNSPDQLVVSGSRAAIELARSKCEYLGAKRVVDLPVSAPFHSSLMVPAADGLAPRLKRIDFQPAEIPVISNLTVQPYPANPQEYPLLLHAQIFNPVRWAETIQYFADQGVTHMLEVGPGKVLRMLAVKTAKQIKSMNIDRESDLESVKAWLAKGDA